MFEYEKLNNLDILVYCGGKCGSSTLHSTFKNNGYVSYKVHDSAYFNYLCNTFKKDTDKTIFDVIDFNIQNDKPIYIIDSYRTPIERKMSAFFQNLGKRINNYNQKTTEDIISIFNETFLYKLEEYHSIDEVMKHYGLPTFTNFDFKNKYNIVKKDNIVFIKIRFNDINEWSDILSTIFEKNIVIFNENLTSNKPINKLYNEFKEKYNLPEKYIYEYLINDKEFKIYNSIEEQNKYIGYWKNKITVIRNKELLINNVKNTSCFKTYVKLPGDYYYGNTDKNVCFLWSPRAGCSITFKCFLDMVGLLDDAENYSNWIHDYKMYIFIKNVPEINIDVLSKKKCNIIKSIVNPYSRAVSIWREQKSHTLSFRDYLKELVNNKITYFNENDKYHLKPQYINGEEKFVTKYIKLDNYEKHDIVLLDGTNYTVDVTKYTSKHHAKRNKDINYFVGDIKLNDIYNKLPLSYKYFYDDEIKEMVYQYYKKDIDFYGYTFEEMV